MSRAPTSIAREQAERQFHPPLSYPQARTVFREAQSQPVEEHEAMVADEPLRQGEGAKDPAAASPASSPAEPAAPAEDKPDIGDWRDGPPPANVIVLVTHDPDKNPQGQHARWYRRRQFVMGRWVITESWVNVLNTSPVAPQPRLWKPDPDRLKLHVLAS